MSLVKMPTCDFCGKARNQTKHMVAGAQEKHICDACIRQIAWIIGEDAAIEGSITAGRKVIPFDKPFAQGRA